MAITTSFGFTINTGITTLTFTDNSTYTSPVRADVGVFLSGAKVAYNNTETVLVLTPDSADVNAVANWTTSYPADGWFKFRYAAVPAYSAVATYAQYDAVYDATTDILYRSKLAANLGNALSNTTYWEVVTVDTLVEATGTATASVNITTAEHDEILYFQAQKIFGDLVEDAALVCTNVTLQPDEVEQYEIMDIFINAMNIANTRERYSDGEKIARKASNITA